MLHYATLLLCQVRFVSSGSSLADFETSRNKWKLICPPILFNLFLELGNQFQEVTFGKIDLFAVVWWGESSVRRNQITATLLMD